MNSSSGELRSVERKYHVRFPQSFERLVSLGKWPQIIGNCFFHPFGRLVSGYHWGFMPTGVLPIASENGDEFCFFFGQEDSRGEPPIAIYLGETDEVFPLASSLRGLLWYAFVMEESRYYGSGSYPNGERRESMEMITRVSRAMNVPYEFGPKFNPDFTGHFNPEHIGDYLDFHNAFLKVDPRAAQSLCWMGKHSLDNDEIDAAADYFERSIQSAPYLAAPYYFLACIRRDQGQQEESVELYWRMSCCPLSSSGSTYWEMFHLGFVDKGIVSSIVDETFSALRENESILLDIAGGDPLADYVIAHEPGDHEARKKLAVKYQDSGQLEKAAREWNNVLYLTWSDEDWGRIAIESLIEIFRSLGCDWAVAMHSDPLP